MPNRERVILVDRIKQLRAERKRYFDVEGDGVDVLLIDIQNYFDHAAATAISPDGVEERLVETVRRRGWKEARPGSKY